MLFFSFLLSVFQLRSFIKLMLLCLVYSLTVIPRARVGCEMIDNHLMSNKREWNNCLIKNNQEILQDFADFNLQEQ